MNSIEYDINDFLENPLNQFMDENNFLGASGNFLTNPKDYRQCFFQPYSPEKPLLGVSTIITAPLAFSLLALQCIYLTAMLTLKALFDIMTCQPNQAASAIKIALETTLWAGLFTLIAVVSPLVNFIDFLGSVFITLRPEREPISIQPTINSENESPDSNLEYK